ncbi:MAG TPA: ORF6N domain-containing protein [Ignavibacteriaceae bacterium]|nr:ORF6N domain-containing protein [Ignavibacteriaceae bacterium]
MNSKSIIPPENIITRILLIREQKVILDRELALLYGVETRALKQAVRRNIKRFPEDFMFQLTTAEFKSWRSQTVMSNSDKKGLRHLPFAFTEQGVAMLSSVLKSERAIEVNILIMRAFVKLREIVSTHKKVEEKLKEIENRLGQHDKQILQIIDVINQLITPPEPVKKKVGFTV